MLLYWVVIVDYLLLVLDYCCTSDGADVLAPLQRIQNFLDIANFVVGTLRQMIRDSTGSSHQYQSTIRLSMISRSPPLRTGENSYFPLDREPLCDALLASVVVQRPGLDSWYEGRHRRARADRPV